MARSALAEAIDELAAADPFSYSDAGTIMDLERQLARLEGVIAKAVACFDDSAEWAPEGAKSAGAWLAARCTLPKGVARRQLRRGAALSALPRTALALLEGDIGVAHLDVLAKAARAVGPEVLRQDEALLVQQATALAFEPFCAAVAYWEQLADPDGTEEAALVRRARRDVFVAESIEGLYLGQITLDPIGGALVAGELSRLTDELFAADWAQASSDLGRPPKVCELGRTGAQRRADALVEMATRSAGAAPDARRPAPLFSVLVGYETLHGRICELANGTVVSPGSLVPWLDGALIERAVFSPPTRVEVSAKARLFSGATKRAIELRDRHCSHPLCDVDAAHCQIDHIVPFSAGGETTQDNGRLLCGFHNRLRHGRPPPAD
jgi:hypothetical protein